MPVNGEIPSSLASQAESYLAAISLQRGLSRNTLTSYRMDLSNYLAFLHKGGISSLTEVKPENIYGYIVNLSGRKLKAASTSRKLSTIRGFHRYLVEAGKTEADPTVNLESPRTSRPLP